MKSKGNGSAAAIIGTQTTVRTPKGEGVVLSYQDGWYKVEVEIAGTEEGSSTATRTLSFRAKDLEVIGTATIEDRMAEIANSDIDETDRVPEHEDPNPPKGKRGNGSAKGKAKAKVARTPRAPKPKVESACLCGCGATTARSFAPGHDARFHGWMRRLAQGEEILSQIPMSARKLMTIKDGMPTTDYDGTPWTFRE